MTRCASFWRKWEEEGNFCGLDPSEISRIKAYLEFVGKIEGTGIDREFVFLNFSEGAARPLIAVKDDETRLKGINYVVACLKRQEKVTAGDLHKTLKAWLKEGGEACSTNARSEKLTNVKNEAQPEPEIEKQTQSEKVEPLPPLSPDAPMDEVLKRDEVLLTRARLHVSDLLSAKPIYPAPLKILAVPLTKAEANQRITDVVRGYLTPKDQTAVAMLLGTGELGDTPLELFEALIWEAADRMGV